MNKKTTSSIIQLMRATIHTLKSSGLALDEPVVITLPTFEDGNVFWYELSRSPEIQIIMGAGEGTPRRLRDRSGLWMAVEVNGIIVRWPPSSGGINEWSWA